MKAKVREAIYEVLDVEMAIDLDQVDPKASVTPLADTDDWTFIFVPEIEKRLGISVPVKLWREVDTVDEMVDLLVKFVESRA